MYQFRKHGFYCNYNPASLDSIKNAVKYCRGTKKDLAQLVKEAKAKGFKVE